MSISDKELKVFDINTYLPKREETFDFLSFAMIDLPGHLVEVVKEISQENSREENILQSSTETKEQKKEPVS